MKQTAVEWLESIIAKMEAYGGDLPPLMVHIQKAKEMEKQQQGYSQQDMKEAYAMGRLNKSIKDFNEKFNLTI